MFDTPGNYVPSGIYLAPPLLAYAVNITNPFFRENSPLVIVEMAHGDDSPKLVEKLKKQPQIYQVQRALIHDYAEKLVGAARIIKESDYDLVLCPLRGGRLPGLQARIICNDMQLFRPFDGTNLSRGGNDKRAMEDLRNIIADGAVLPSRKIAVLDHAKGGNSCDALARLLGLINADTTEKWTVDFFLLHPSDHRPSRASNAYSYQTVKYGVQVFLHPVSSLLVEDEDALLGYEVQQAGENSYSSRLQIEGQLLLIEPGKTTLLKAAPLDETLIAVVGEEIGNVIAGIEDVTLVDPDYWTKLQEG